jgi:predicted hydrocarbon binding protein
LTQETIQIKGFAVRGLLKYVKESGHPGGIPALLAGLDPAAMRHFENKILSSNWYPYEAFVGLLHAIDAELGQGDRAVMPSIGEFSGRQDAGSIFRFVAALSSIESIVQRADFLWQRYCTRGRFEVVELEPGRLRLALDEFPEIDRAHCALIAGWIRGLGEAVGAHQANFEQTSCVHRGDGRCEFAGTWQS